MNKKLNLNAKLDFSEMDLTEPNKVIEEILSELPGETNDLVLGQIKQYNGAVKSYVRQGITSISKTLGEEKVDIQKDLGAKGNETHKFECYLYSPEYENYRYRMFFVEYGVASYPVNIILEESIAKEIRDASSSAYIFKCVNRSRLEDLIIKVLTCDKVVNVMQELIRLSQIKKQNSVGEVK